MSRFQGRRGRSPHTKMARESERRRPKLKVRMLLPMSLKLLRTSEAKNSSLNDESEKRKSLARMRVRKGGLQITRREGSLEKSNLKRKNDLQNMKIMISLRRDLEGKRKRRETYVI